MASKAQRRAYFSHQLGGGMLVVCVADANIAFIFGKEAWM